MLRSGLSSFCFIVSNMVARTGFHIHCCLETCTLTAAVEQKRNEREKKDSWSELHSK